MAAYSRRRLSEMLGAVDGAASSEEKGTALEGLATYLFTRIPGIDVIATDLVDASQAHELDIALWNTQTPLALPFLDAILIVECKASESAVGSEDVSWFATKLRRRGARDGVLLALNGITGGRNGTSAAHSEILGALPEGVRVLVVTRRDIESLASSADLVVLLKQRLMDLVLRRAVEQPDR